MSERKRHWENVYRSKSPDEVSWFQVESQLSLQLITSIGLAPEAALIDVGGGASRLVDGLLDAGYQNISVLDVSAQALAHAQARLGDKADRVQWIEQDVTCFEATQQYSVWHDRAVFHFLTDKVDRQRYIHALKNALEPGGQLIMMAFATDGPLKCSGLEIVQYDVNKLGAELGSGFELVENGYEIHTTPAGGQQKFAWFRFIHTPKTP